MCVATEPCPGADKRVQKRGGYNYKLSKVNTMKHTQKICQTKITLKTTITITTTTVTRRTKTATTTTHKLKAPGLSQPG